jgi:hypothetical protein
MSCTFFFSASLRYQLRFSLVRTLFEPPVVIPILYLRVAINKQLVLQTYLIKIPDIKAIAINRITDLNYHIVSFRRRVNSFFISSAH